MGGERRAARRAAGLDKIAVTEEHPREQTVEGNSKRTARETKLGCAIGRWLKRSMGEGFYRELMIQKYCKNCFYCKGVRAKPS